jgi:hypothetical protein
MSDHSLDLHAAQDALNQPEYLLASLGPAEQLEQARDHLLAERGNAARALDPSPWLNKHNTRVRQENAEAHLRRRGPFLGNFFTSECVAYVNRAALALACLAGWEWAWKQLVVQHRTVLFEHNKHFATQMYTAVSACATLSEASKAAWEWLLQTTGCASPLMNPWTVEDVQRIWRTDPQRLLQTFAQCSPLFSAAGKPCLEVNRGTEIEIETIRTSSESAVPAPAPTSADPPPPLETNDQEPVILALGQQQYRLGTGTVFLASDPQDDVLQAYLDNPPKWKAAKRLRTPELEERSKRTGQIHRIMDDLKNSPLGAAIDLPGKERKGQGYGVRVRRHAPTSV